MPIAEICYRDRKINANNNEPNGCRNESPHSIRCKLKANEASSIHYTYIRFARTLERSNCQYVYHFNSFFSSTNKNTRNNYYYTTNNHSACPFFHFFLCIAVAQKPSSPLSSITYTLRMAKTVSLFNLWLLWGHRYGSCFANLFYFLLFWVAGSSARQKANRRRKMGTFSCFGFC